MNPSQQFTLVSKADQLAANAVIRDLKAINLNFITSIDLAIKHLRENNPNSINETLQLLCFVSASYKAIEQIEQIKQQIPKEQNEETVIPITIEAFHSALNKIFGDTPDTCPCGWCTSRRELNKQSSSSDEQSTSA